jgi:arylsulfatase A-like enzyme
VALGAAGALVVLLVAGAGAAETLRWHLLRHNTLLGTPFYYLVEPAVEEVQHALVADASRVPPPPAAAPTPTATAPEAPHLIFVLLDTLRVDALAAWDGDPELMPLLNQRLESAVRLTNVQANASWTRPSMASYFTGLLPEEHGAVGVEDALADGFRTLAEELSDRGYRTVAFTTNIAATGRGAGFAQGFDTFVQLEGSPYARAERVRRALDAWLQEHEPAGPVFLYLHFLDPHEPYLAGEAPRRKRPAPYRRAYQRELRYLDRELDAILDRAESALPGPEILLVASDHGEELFEHELFGHGLSLYQEVLHVPVAVTVPGGRPGRSVAAPLEARDVHGLLLDLVADPTLDPAAWAHGHARDRRYASLDYSTTGRLILRPYLARVAMRAIQEGHEKLVWSAYGDTRELYDLKDDPGETRNLLAERPERAAALTRALGEAVGAWVERTPVVPSDAERQQLEALGYVE